MTDSCPRFRHSTSLVARCALALVALGACREATQPAASYHASENVSASPGFSYRITEIGNLGGTIALAWRVNERGQVVGWATTASGDTDAFIWTAQRGISDLGTLANGKSTIAWGINNEGVVVGEVNLPRGHTRAFEWTAAGGMRDLGTLGGEDALALGINDRGEVVGFSTLFGGGPTHGFVWTARGGMKDAGVFNDANTRLRTIDNSGRSGAGTGQGQAVLWHPSTGFTGLGFLAGGGFSYGARINDREQVVGFSDTGISVHAFRWTANTAMTDLGSLNGAAGRSEALDISNGGNIVGGTTTASDTANLHAFVWTPARGMSQLPVLSGDAADEAYGINESGTIVGYADSPDGRRHAVVWTAAHY